MIALRDILRRRGGSADRDDLAAAAWEKFQKDAKPTKRARKAS